MHARGKSGLLSARSKLELRPRTTQNRQGLQPAFCLRVPAVPVTVASLRRIGSGSTASASSDPGVTAPKVIDTMPAQARVHAAPRFRCSLIWHDGCMWEHVCGCSSCRLTQGLVSRLATTFLHSFAEGPWAATCSSR